MYKIASALLVVAVILSACSKNQDKEIELKKDSIKVEDNSINYSWDELSYEEYLQEAMDEKGLKEEELQSLKLLGFSRAEIQAMNEDEAKKHIKALKKFVAQYHDGLKMEYFETVTIWKDIAKRDNLVWTDGSTTVNAHLISEYIGEMGKGNAKLLILYIDRVMSIVFESGKGITLMVYYEDGTKEQINCDAIEETEQGYVLKGSDIIIYK